MKLTHLGAFNQANVYKTENEAQNICLQPWSKIEGTLHPFSLSLNVPIWCLCHPINDDCDCTSLLLPGDFITNMKQVNSQSDLISMSSFAGPSYPTLRSSFCIILIWDPCICNLYNLCQTWSNYTLQKPHQCAHSFTEQITRVHFLLLQLSIWLIPAQVILLWKGPPKLCIECHLVPLWAFPLKSPGSLVSVTLTSVMAGRRGGTNADLPMCWCSFWRWGSNNYVREYFKKTYTKATFCHFSSCRHSFMHQVSD